MEPLSTEAQARLAAFRRAESPPPGAAERCLAAIEQRLEDGDGDAAVLAFAPRPRSLAAPLLGGLALAACALLALTWVVASGTQAPRDDVAAPYHTGDARPEHLTVERAPRPRAAARPAAERAVPEDTVPEDIQPPTDALAEPVHSDILDPPAPADSAAAEPAPADSAAADQAAPPSAAPADKPRRPDLVAAEVDLLRRAKLAAPADRLALLDEHARRFPAGILAAERELLVIETRCALHEVERARHLAARFMRRFPGSPLVERAATICGGPDSAR